jgi:hypothetical protein
LKTFVHTETFFFLVGGDGTRNWIQGLHIEAVHQPFFDGFFKMDFSQTICPVWLQTVILLICLLSSWDYRHEISVPGSETYL